MEQGTTAKRERSQNSFYPCRGITCCVEKQFIGRGLMEANICDINHLDADVLLPPRKRLLAGLKKQSSDGDATLHPSPIAMTSNEFDARLNKLLSSHLKNPSLTPEEIVEASRSAAKAAAKAAEAARAAAEEKAAIAAKAMAAAKSALELIASVSEETSSKERYLKKNKSKKHVPVQLLYKKHQPVENYRTDEELARKLHRAMNSSPRISKNSSSSDWKNHKHKKPKIFPAVEKTRVPNGGMVLEGNSPSTCNGSSIAADQLETDNGEAGCSKEKNSEALDHLSTTGRKRGRIKLKKLPLSICTIRDRANPKEELKSRSNIPLFSVGPSAGSVMPVEATTMWKCQEFKAPACVKQNKVVQS
uniref:Uncharacterized protein n=1 Tax=Vitis vinifera TaxID=29760 RepID=F6H4C9_VITVI